MVKVCRAFTSRTLPNVQTKQNFRIVQNFILDESEYAMRWAETLFSISPSDSTFVELLCKHILLHLARFRSKHHIYVYFSLSHNKTNIKCTIFKISAFSLSLSPLKINVIVYFNDFCVNFLLLRHFSLVFVLCLVMMCVHKS